MVVLLGGVAVDVGVGVEVTVGVEVFVGVDVFVGEEVGVLVGVFVAVDVGVSVEVGVLISAIHVRTAGVGSLLPAASVAVTWNVCDPGSRLLNDCGEPQSSISTSSMKQMYEAGSLEEKVNVAESLLTVPEGPESIVVFGAVLSTVTTWAAEVVELNPKSIARAVRVADPSLTVLEFQIML
jgi:hypothetical protein